MKTKLWVVILLLTVGLMGCDSDEKKPTPIQEISFESPTFLAAIDYEETITVKVIPTERLSDVTWKSSAPEIVSVDQEGKITPKALGKATITATVDDKSASCEVEVIVPVTQLELLELGSRSHYVGDQFKLELKVVPENADRRTITFTSSNKEVVNIDNDGLATMVGVGEVEIIAKSKFKKYDLAAKLTVVSRPSIFVAGVINQNTAVYWQNGVMTELTDGGIVAQVNDIFVTPKGDVYAVGYDSPNDTGINRAVLWINGKMQYLTDGKKDTQAKSVVVVGDDVYVAGNEIGAKNKCFLWKNGTATVLPSNKPYAEVGGLWIDSEQNSYVVGYDDGPAVWKNGEKKDLGLGDNTHQLLNIFMKGSDTYYVGYKADEVFGDWAMLWKGNTPTTLSDGTADSYANAVWVSDGGDVYVAGNQGGFKKKALLWKNGEAIDLSTDSYKAADLMGYGEELWVVGSVQTGGFPFGTQKAVIWKDGKSIILSNMRSEARAIFVRTK